MSRSVSDLPQHNTVTYSLEEILCIGIYGQHMFTVRVLFQRFVDPVHESKPLLLWTRTQRTRSHHNKMKNKRTVHTIKYVVGFWTWYYHIIV